MWEFAVLGGLAAGGGMIWAFGESRKILNRWRAAVESCGLRVDKISSPLSFFFRIRASDGPIELRARYTRRKDQGGLRVLVRFDGLPGVSEISLRKEVGGVQRKQREIELGDKAFDDSFFIQGPLRHVGSQPPGPARSGPGAGVADPAGSRRTESPLPPHP